MKNCTEAVQTEVSLVERPDEPWPHSPGLSTTAEAYWRSLYERERTRAEEAEARCEELRWAEVDSRARAGTLKWQFDKCRKKLAARVGEVKEARAEVARLEKREETIASLREELEGREKDVARLEDRLAWEKIETADHKKTIQYREEELIRLYGKLRESRDDLRVSLRAAGRMKERLKERLLRAKEALRSRSSRRDAELRKALGRSRRQKQAIRRLSGGNERLRRLRAAIRNERRASVAHRRDRSLGPQARHPPSAVAQEVRLRVVSGGSVGTARAAPGCGHRSARTRSTSTSTPRGVRRSR